MIRNAKNQDLEQIKDLFRNTILSVNSSDYDEEQLYCWINRGSEDRIWKEKIQDDFFIVSVQAQQILGFASITNEGCLDMFYVHKYFQGQGIASQLMKAIEQFAYDRQLKKLTAHVSITAKSFFLHAGFEIEKYQTIDIGVMISNYIMIKNLN